MTILLAIICIGSIAILASLSSTLDDMDISDINIDDLWMTYFAFKDQF